MTPRDRELLLWLKDYVERGEQDRFFENMETCAWFFVTGLGLGILISLG